jgi:hypothetical protein
VEGKTRFAAALKRIDAANAEHPETLDYSKRMTTWLDRLAPDASDALRLAVRAQHIRRWRFPRDQFPMTRVGYHAWRTAAGQFHAEQVDEILRDVGYDQPFISRVQALVRKEGLKAGDSETQRLEDSTCLAFLEQGFAEFAARHDEAKVIRIVQRTWRKMSPEAQQAALTLSMSPDARRIVEQALTQASQPAPGGTEDS